MNTNRATTGDTMTSQAFAAREFRISQLCDRLQDADRDENDELAARTAERLRGLGCDVEWTNAGWMVTR